MQKKSRDGKRSFADDPYQRVNQRRHGGGGLARGTAGLTDYVQAAQIGWSDAVVHRHMNRYLAATWQLEIVFQARRGKEEQGVEEQWRGEDTTAGTVAY